MAWDKPGHEMDVPALKQSCPTPSLLQLASRLNGDASLRRHSKQLRLIRVDHPSCYRERSHIKQRRSRPQAEGRDPPPRVVAQQIEKALLRERPMHHQPGIS